MDRGKYNLSYDMSYYIIDSISRELCIKTDQRPQPQLSILKETLNEIHGKFRALQVDIMPTGARGHYKIHLGFFMNYCINFLFFSQNDQENELDLDPLLHVHLTDNTI